MGSARPTSSGALTHRTQQRDNHLIDRRGNAVLPPLSHNHPIPGVELQRPACQPVCQYRIDSIRRLCPEPIQDLLTEAFIQPCAFSFPDGYTFSHNIQYNLPQRFILQHARRLHH